jgi:hypothetical protein
MSHWRQALHILLWIVVCMPHMAHQFHLPQTKRDRHYSFLLKCCLYRFSIAAITKYHRLGNLYTRNSFLRCEPGWFSSEVPSLAWMVTFSPYLYMCSISSTYKVTNHIRRWPTLMTSSYLNHLFKDSCL